MWAGSFSLRNKLWGAKKKSTETKSPEVSANLCCAISQRHTAAFRNRKVHLQSSQQQRWILWSRNPMKWDDRFHVLQSLWRPETISENSQNVVPTKTDYAIATVKEVLTLSQSALQWSQFRSCKGHWGCTECYSSMRGSLYSAFEGCKTIDQNFNQEASDVKQKVKELQLRSAISLSLSWTT